MTTTTLEKPPCMHREVKPVRECRVCGAYLTSANEDDVCAKHGGWAIQLSERQVKQDRIDLLSELMEAA